MLRHAWLRRKHAALAKKPQATPIADYLSAPLPDPARHWRAIDYVALDIETTGLDPASDAMISVGWVLVIDGQVRLSTAQSLLVHTKRKVGQSATIHGLTDTVVSEGQDESVVMAAILAVLKGRALLVHYAKLDQGVLDRVCETLYGTAVPMVLVDTMEIELRRRGRRHHTDAQQSVRLMDLRAARGLPAYAAHNCLTDAIATAELFLAMAATDDRDGRLTLRDLLR